MVIVAVVSIKVKLNSIELNSLLADFWKIVISDLLQDKPSGKVSTIT